jgi:hypothetical protein
MQSLQSLPINSTNIKTDLTSLDLIQDLDKDTNEKLNQDEFETVDDLASKQNLIDCYQMQVDKNNECYPVHLGKYPDVPLPVNHIIKYKKYILHYVTYVLTKDEIDNKLYKIIGVNVFRQNRKSSMCSLDLVKNGEEGRYQLLFNDHKNNKSIVVENLEKFPGKDKALAYVINKSFEEPLKTILTR